MWLPLLRSWSIESRPWNCLLIIPTIMLWKSSYLLCGHSYSIWLISKWSLNQQHCHQPVRGAFLNQWEWKHYRRGSFPLSNQKVKEWWWLCGDASSEKQRQRRWGTYKTNHGLCREWAFLGVVSATPFQLLGVADQPPSRVLGVVRPTPYGPRGGQNYSYDNPLVWMIEWW
jgi:hypothetical protein